MTRRAMPVVVCLLVVLATAVSAQDTDRTLQAYRGRFGDASIEGKLQILRTADQLTPAQLGPLYNQAIQFVLTNAADLPTNTALQEIVAISVDGIDEGGYSAAANTLWALFREHGDNTSRIRVLNALASVAVGNRQVVVDLNAWLQSQTNLFRGGTAPDLQVFRAAIQTAGALGDSSSFPVLLDIQVAQMSAAISAEARSAMLGLDADYKAAAIQTINARGVTDRLPALEYVLDDSELSMQERAEIATAVLAATTREVVRLPTDVEAQRQVRYRAATTLVAEPYPAATAALIRHFNATFADYDRGVTTRTWVLEAIAALGNTGTVDAARRLATFLDLLNNYTENDRPYDTQIMLAVVTNLGRLGHFEAYDALFYATLLNYPTRVRDAAREAIDAVRR